MRSIAYLAAVTLSLMACTTSDKPAAIDTSAAMPASGMSEDADRNAGGGALPAGYIARTDKADADITGAKYVTDGGDWEVTTGPPHVIYSSKDVGAGTYTATAVIEQLEAPAHPEAFGVFIGGRDLDKPTQAYTYLLVRGTGEVLIKVREGDATRDVIKWTPSADVPKGDGAGRARYEIAAQVTADALKMMINGTQVASVSKAGLPTEGIAGIRINHNLHVKVTPVTIKRP
ncbi:MAG: hypothetical protein ABIS03_11645 [Gemmatimonadaceae bacterium]